jgi:hypothetical protein
MAWLGQQLHAKGLKFGIYEDIGTTTCGEYPGSWDHFQQDANFFASWAVDFIKMDGCNMPSASNNAAGYIKAYHDQCGVGRIGELVGGVAVREVRGEDVPQAHEKPGIAAAARARLPSGDGCSRLGELRSEGRVDEHDAGGHPAAYEASDDLPDGDELVPDEGLLLVVGEGRVDVGP